MAQPKRIRKKGEPTQEEEESREFVEATKTVSGVGTKVTLSDNTIVEIRKLRVGQLGIYITALSELFENLGIRSFTELDSQSDLMNPSKLLKGISGSFDKVSQLLCGVCSLDKSEIDELELDDAATIAMAAWELNKDFLFRMGLIQPVPKSSSDSSKGAKAKR